IEMDSRTMIVSQWRLETPLARIPGDWTCKAPRSLLARLPQLTTCFTIFPASDAKPVLQGIDASGVGAAPLAVRAKTPM
ncbi:MAG: hypothetical protein WCO67_22620, partial [Betaproteobacteria bacterium]